MSSARRLITLGACCVLLGGLILSCGDYPGLQSSAKAITAFVFAAADNPGLATDAPLTVSEPTLTVTGTLPFGTAVTAMRPTIAVSPRATVTPTSLAARDFTGSATYIVTAEDGTTATYSVTVQVEAGRGGKAITSFVFEAANNSGLTADLTMTVSEAAGTVAGTLPLGPAVTALKPTIVASAGATVRPASGAAQDFSAPVTYTVTAEDGTAATFVATLAVRAAAAAVAGTLEHSYLRMDVPFAGSATGAAGVVVDITPTLTVIDALATSVPVALTGHWTTDATTGALTGWSATGRATFAPGGTITGTAEYLITCLGKIHASGAVYGEVSIVPSATPTANADMGSLVGVFEQGSAAVAGLSVFRGPLTSTVGTYDVYSLTPVTLLQTGTVTDDGAVSMVSKGSTFGIAMSIVATSTPSTGGPAVFSVTDRTVGVLDASAVFTTLVSEQWDSQSRAWGVLTQGSGSGEVFVVGTGNTITWSWTGNGTVTYTDLNYRVVTTNMTVTATATLVP